MKLRCSDAGLRTCSEWDLLRECHDLDRGTVIDIGCGAAVTTRQIAEAWPTAAVTGLEVDAIQHRTNSSTAGPPNLRFAEAGAEAMPLDDASVDAAFLFKSLHHVPVDAMPAALQEIHRVLKPGGRAHIVEPVFDGPFNDILRLFHDEQRVRQRAFDAIVHAVDSGAFRLEREIHHLAPLHFDDFAAFEADVIGVTHTDHDLSAQHLEAIRVAFDGHMTDDGAHFLQPLRLDLLVRP